MWGEGHVFGVELVKNLQEHSDHIAKKVERVRVKRMN
jgi:hypothetical protein